MAFGPVVEGAECRIQGGRCSAGSTIANVNIRVGEVAERGIHRHDIGVADEIGHAIAARLRILRPCLRPTANPECTVSHCGADKPASAQRRFALSFVHNAPETQSAGFGHAVKRTSNEHADRLHFRIHLYCDTSALSPKS